MDEWKPIAVLPNLDICTAFECKNAAIVSVSDERVRQLCKAHPTLKTFLSKFTDQFGKKLWPSLLLLRAKAPKSCFTAEAITAFRDILSLSIVPYARASRLPRGRPNALAFNTAFHFYPWMLDKDFEDLILINPALMHEHLVREFEGQAFPEQSQISVAESDIDIPLANELRKYWMLRFAGRSRHWRHKALFRSLNMANEAARIPALTAATFFDVGRSLALWISAHEILTHPGGKSGAGFETVAATLERVTWRDRKLRAARYKLPGKGKRRAQLATRLYKVIYDLRNAFLHGNDVKRGALSLNRRPVIDFAACIYRLTLTGFLDLSVKGPIPSMRDNPGAFGAFIARKMEFDGYQKSYENALLSAVAGKR